MLIYVNIKYQISFLLLLQNYHKPSGLKQGKFIVSQFRVLKCADRVALLLEVPRRIHSWPFAASSSFPHSLAHKTSFLFKVRYHIALTSAPVLTSPLTLTVLRLSYDDPCDYTEYPNNPE